MRGDKQPTLADSNGRPVFTAEERNVIVQSGAHLSNKPPERAVRLIQKTDGLVLT